MPLFQRLYNTLYAHLINVSWPVIIIMIAVHYLVFQLLFAYVGDVNISTGFTDFTYFYVVSGSTVGYGDISPSTTFGKWATCAFIITGIVILGTFLSKIGITLSSIVKRRLMGMNSYENRKNHIVLFGYRGDDTMNVISEISRTQPCQIVLVDDQLEQTPDSSIFFVKVARLTAKDAFMRSGLENASGVIIHGASDDQTLAICTAMNGYIKERNVVAYFDNDEMAEIVKSNSPTVGCVVPKSTDLIARSVMHPGSMDLFNTILSTKHEQTQFASTLMTNKVLNFGSVSATLSREHNALLVGMSVNGNIMVNPDRHSEVPKGAVLYYISKDHLGDSIIL